MYKEKIRITIIMAVASHSFPFTHCYSKISEKAFMAVSVTFLIKTVTFFSFYGLSQSFRLRFQKYFTYT